jgi:hypothetical protein
VSGADPIQAIRTLLLADATVAALVGTRGWGGELPPSSVAGMPRAGFLVRSAGGGAMGTGDYLSTTDARVDVFCYGGTPHEANALYRAVRHALRYLRRTVQNTTVLYWAKESGGPNSLRESDTEWPLTLSSWQVYWSDQEVLP